MSGFNFKCFFEISFDNPKLLSIIALDLHQ